MFWQLPAVLLHTFATAGKSMSHKPVEDRGETNLFVQNAEAYFLVGRRHLLRSTAVVILSVSKLSSFGMNSSDDKDL